MGGAGVHGRGAPGCGVGGSACAHLSVGAWCHLVAMTRGVRPPPVLAPREPGVLGELGVSGQRPAQPLSWLYFPFLQIIQTAPTDAFAQPDPAPKGAAGAEPRLCQRPAETPHRQPAQGLTHKVFRSPQGQGDGGETPEQSLTVASRRFCSQEFLQPQHGWEMGTLSCTDLPREPYGYQSWARPCDKLGHNNTRAKLRLKKKQPKHQNPSSMA